jgi:CBS domain-containing protein
MNADVTVREIMDPEYVGVSESDDLVETVELLLREEADTAVVLRGSDPLGVVTERDVLSLLVEGPEPEDAVVTDAMSESVPTVAPDASLEAAADRMSAREVRRLVVTNGAEPLGIITEHDLLTARVHQPGTRQEERNDVPAGSSEASVAMETEASPQDSFEEQGICEVCGTLTRDLAAFNGQLRCSDCRDM